MAKRIVIDINEDPALLPEQWDEFLGQLNFAVDGWFEIREYTMKVENE